MVFNQQTLAMPLAEVSKGHGHILNSFGQNRLAFQLCFGITKFVPPTVPKLMPCVNSMKVSLHERTYVLRRHLVRKILAKYYSDSVCTPAEPFILRQGDQVTSLLKLAWSVQLRSMHALLGHHIPPKIFLPLSLSNRELPALSLITTLSLQ